MNDSMRPTVRDLSTRRDRPNWPLPPVRHGTPERAFWRAAFAVAMLSVVAIELVSLFVR